jgi:hypothetical protein
MVTWPLSKVNSAARKRSACAFAISRSKAAAAHKRPLPFIAWLDFILDI